ncbi:LOW QUALITY PROTEIN: 39S ribosomal protein L19, mitochondrial-like [Ctenocephalides felis]|uniref:LOW QUALITY PROTEIN: 39S ribosomal protein L19, mitochondrial-like n=1 Tax=Ctenocephalides felis TaxID=7515 RepID=UPI000E6E1F4A|nr:LOW QUALITY PROTEIN: 39S ribosomal protein L19, mitochondrial-like [Ctenocephalides felis]
MYLPSRILINEFKQNVKVLTNLVAQVNTFSTKPELKSSNEELPNVLQSNNDKKASTPVDYRFIYPEFLPDPKIEWRNAVREKLERKDMLSRRAHIDIPEFYVGTIMAVTTSDVHSEGKTSRFVGICIDRSGCGLRSKFILRNVVDHQGCEVLYEMYDPTIKKIEVLRLEKRLDSKLFYLRDALPEFSTFPLDMEAEILPEGAPIPVNEIKVKLKPRPWLERWERQDLKGIQPLELPKKFFIKAKERSTPWEKYDLMKQYRATIPEEEQNVIYAEVYSELHQLELMRRKQKRRRIFVKPVKAA